MSLPFKNPVILYSDVPDDNLRHEDDSAYTTVLAIQKNLSVPVHVISIPYPCSHNDFFHLMKELERVKADFVFNFCEEVNGDSYYEGNVAALLELWSLPFSGNKAEALFFCRDKFRVGCFLKQNGFPVPGQRLIIDEADLFHPVNPVIIKPACEDGSLGINEKSLCFTYEDMKQVFESLGTIYKSPLLAEEYIHGREINVSLLNGETVACSEVMFSGAETNAKILTYEAKWETESEAYKSSLVQCPALLEKELESEIRKISENAHKLLGLRHYARIDFRISHDRRPFIIDVNPNPCIAPGSGFIIALESQNLNFKKIIEVFTGI